jgi:hypothetical protein
LEEIRLKLRNLHQGVDTLPDVVNLMIINVAELEVQSHTARKVLKAVFYNFDECLEVY